MNFSSKTCVAFSYITIDIGSHNKRCIVALEELIAMGPRLLLPWTCKQRKRSPPILPSGYETVDDPSPFPHAYTEKCPKRHSDDVTRAILVM